MSQGANFAISVIGSTNGDQVVLLDGNTQIGPVLSLSSGAANYAAPLAVGQHKITAVYLGNGTTAGSTSPVVTIERSPRPKTR